MDLTATPYGLSGGVYLSGSVSFGNNGNSYFAYYPIASSEANINFANIVNGSAVTGSFTAGIPIYGQITAVTQSSGIAFLYQALNASY